jgi:dynein heavy chain
MAERHWNQVSEVMK